MTQSPATAPFGMTPVEIIAFTRSICRAAAETRLTSIEQLLAACRHALAALYNDLCRDPSVSTAFFSEDHLEPNVTAAVMALKDARLSAHYATIHIPEGPALPAEQVEAFGARLLLAVRYLQASTHATIPDLIWLITCVHIALVLRLFVLSEPCSMPHKMRKTRTKLRWRP